MSVECFPITVLPHVSQLYRDYLDMAASPSDAALRHWYGAEPFTGAPIARNARPITHNAKPIAANVKPIAQNAKPGARSWMHSVKMHSPTHSPTHSLNHQISKSPGHISALADLLSDQAEAFHASASSRESIAKLRAGARAIVTGQQVVLFGGPLLTLLKAATAIARAAEATAATGIDHVPIFWLASEDHDLDEVDQVSFLTKTNVETLRANLKLARAVPVGGVIPGPALEAVLDRAAELLENAPISDWLRECYLPPIESKADSRADPEPPSLALAFGRLMAKIFAGQSLILIDPAARGFHALGASTLRYAIEHAAPLQQSLLTRSQELIAAGYHAQVLVAKDASLLFLLDESTTERVALRHTSTPEGGSQWKAGNRTYTTADLLAILEAAPERLSPNALLRPVFQDTLLPTTAYIGGPSEIAYFAQSAVLYEAILGRITPVLPRLSATLLEPAIASVMDKDEIQLPDAMSTPEALAQRLGARAMPIEAKRRLAAAGNALETELAALTQYLAAMDPSLGRAATVSGSKMHYQMNRLRRMAATFELQKETSLRKHAKAITLNVFPTGHPQERVLAGVWFLSRYGESLIDRLIQTAANQCPGHIVIRL